MSKIYTFLAILLISSIIYAKQDRVQLKVYPPAKFQKLESQYLFSNKSGCPAKLKVAPKIQGLELLRSNPKQNLQQLLQYYTNKINERQLKMSECMPQDLQAEYPIKIKINPKLNQEGYSLKVNKQNAIIQIESYKGYVYAMQTLSQLINKDIIVLGEVKDQPIVSYRGIMIDSVRHFISFSYIQKLIQSMPVSKLNMLHWHLADDQAFVLSLFGHPQLASGSAYDGNSYYTIDQVLSLISLAQKNGVNIIPEFDTPAHVRSWSQSYQWQTKNITILCPKGEHYNHQFDLSKQSVYTLTAQVLNQVAQIFSTSPYLHMGGDQVFGACWDLRPQIKQFMQRNHISGYGELQMYWRNRIKQQAKLEHQSLIYWRNNAQNVTTKPDQILQFWGAQSDIAKVVGDSQSKVILSSSDYLYLNKGQSFIWQNGTFGPYKTWKQIYQNLIIFPQGVEKQRILGAEACLWGEVSNQFTLENNLWPRAASFAFRAWSDKIMNINQLFQGLLGVKRTLESMGVQSSPLSSQYCETYTKVCFPPPQKSKIELKVQ